MTTNPYYHLIKDYKWSILTEGLIKTYPITVAISRLEKLPYIEKVTLRTSENPQDTTPQLEVIINHTATRENFHTLSQLMQQMGYSEAYHTLLPQWDTLSIYEALYPLDISPLLRRNYTNLIHITTQEKAKKIQQIGLIPHTNSIHSPLTYSQARTYFFTGNTLDTYQQAAANAILQQHPSQHYVAILLSLSKIPISTKFYTDTMTYEAVYTLDNIPPQAILSIESFLPTTLY